MLILRIGANITQSKISNTSLSMAEYYLKTNNYLRLRSCIKHIISSRNFNRAFTIIDF